MSDYLQVVAVEGVRLGYPDKPGFVGYVKLPAGKTEGAAFTIPTKVNGSEVVESVAYALKDGPTTVPNDRFYRRMLRQGALELYKPRSSGGSGGSGGTGKGKNADANKGRV